MGYFEDRHVARVVLKRLGCLPFSNHESAQRERETANVDNDNACYGIPRQQALISKIVGVSAGAIVVLVPIVVLGSIIITGRMHTYRQWNSRLQETVLTGKPSIAKMHHSMEEKSASTTAVIIDHWMFRYDDLKGRPVEWKGDTGEIPLAPGVTSGDFLDENNWHFDDGFVRKVRGQMDCGDGCNLSIPILVNLQQPEYFVVSGEAPKFGFWSQVGTIITREMLALQFVVMVSLLSSLFAGAFAALIGERAIDVYVRKGRDSDS